MFVVLVVSLFGPVNFHTNFFCQRMQSSTFPEDQEKVTTIAYLPSALLPGPAAMPVAPVSVSGATHMVKMIL